MKKIFSGFPYSHKKRRKKVEEKLPEYKKKVNSFNKKYLYWIEYLVETLIPFLLIVLIFVIFVAESEHLYHFLLNYNIEWKYLLKVAEYNNNNLSILKIIDEIIITFFALDLFFNFFKKTTKQYLKTYFIDILAIIPIAWIFRIQELIVGVERTQEAVHVITQEEKIISKTISTISKEERAVEAASRFAKAEKIESLFARITRFFRAFFIRHEVEEEIKIEKKIRKKSS